MIKCGEEDDPIGVSTVLNLARHGGSKPLQELRSFLLAAAGGHRDRLEKVGLLAGPGRSLPPWLHRGWATSCAGAAVSTPGMWDDRGAG